MTKHRLFISWSRAQAGEISPILKTFFQDVLGINDIFLSKEIDSGRRWSDEIAQALDSCDAGLILVTNENKGAPWLNFEAGAISKRLAKANVVPLLWDISVGDIADTPLNQFQCKSFHKDDLQSVLQSFGKLWDLPLDPILRRFSAMWSDFNDQLGQVSEAPLNEKGAPSIQDLYSLVQRISSRIDGLESTIDSIEMDVSQTLFEQSEIARVLPAKSANLILSHLNATDRNREVRDRLQKNGKPTNSSSEEVSLGGLLGEALKNPRFSRGDTVSHVAFGQGTVRDIHGDLAIVQFEHGNTQGVAFADLSRKN